MKRIAGLIPAAALVFTVACGQTDAGITTDVKAKLAADETVSAFQVDVDTNNKVVTLSGRVNTLAAKEHAVLLARQASGVQDVIDNLQVADTAPTSGRLDSDIDSNIDDTVREGADAAGDAARRTGNAVGDKAREGADAVSDAARRTGDSVRDSDVGEKVEDKTREGGNAIVEGAKKTGEAAKKGAQAVGEGAKKIGVGIKDAVTDDKD